MSFNIKRLLLLLVISVSFVTPVSALEPLPENRARISDLHGALMLPDYSILDFNMSFDCGSKYETTAMIITSKAGAQLLAASYTHMWGEAAGDMVMYNWNNKADPTDPRLPTFLVVTPPSGANFDWKKSVRISTYKSSTLNTSTTETTESDDIPVLLATCGTRSHEPTDSD